jgi:hypothetical protein
MSMAPSAWTITCSASDCHRDRWSPLSKPLVIQAATRAGAVKAARLAGWVPCSLLISGGTKTDDWWCPGHVARTRQAAMSDEIEPSRRKQLLAWYRRADELREAARNAS